MAGCITENVKQCSSIVLTASPGIKIVDGLAILQNVGYDMRYHEHCKNIEPVLHYLALVHQAFYIKDGILY